MPGDVYPDVATRMLSSSVRSSAPFARAKTFRGIHDRPNAATGGIVQVSGARHLRVTRSEQTAITDFVINGRPSTWEELCNRVHPSDRTRAEAVLANAIALGRIRVDRNATIHDGSVVTPIDPSTNRVARD